MRRPLRRLVTLAPTLLLAPVLLAGCGDDEPGGADGPTTSSAPSTTSIDSTPPTSDPSTPDPSTPSTGEPTRQPPITPSTQPDPPDGGVDATVLGLLHMTAAGGRVQEVATPVGDQARAEEFLSQLTDADFRSDVAGRIAASRGFGEIYAAVVAVGCDVPPGVSVQVVPDGYAVRADKIARPTPECFAPVTTVAVVSVNG